MIWIALVFLVVDWTVGVGGLLFLAVSEIGGIDIFAHTTVSVEYYPALFGVTLGIITVTKLILGRGGTFNV